MITSFSSTSSFHSPPCSLPSFCSKNELHDKSIPQMDSPPPRSLSPPSSPSPLPPSTEETTAKFSSPLALLMVKSFFLHHKITRQGQEDFPALVNALYDNNIPLNTVYKFKKRLHQYMPREGSSIEVHHYCSKCYDTSSTQLQCQDVDNGQFHTVSLSYQLSNLFKSKYTIAMQCYNYKF